MKTATSALPPQRRLASAPIVLSFVLLYILLDWTSSFAPTREINVTAWNPAPALGVYYVVRRGHRAIPVLFAAILLSDLINRAVIASVPTLLVSDLMLALGYSIIGLSMLKRFPQDNMFANRSNLFVWATLAVVSSLLNGMAFLTVLGSAGMLLSDNWVETLLKFWIGDAVGIFVNMPLLWWLADRQRRTIFTETLLRAETFAYICFAAMTIWFAFIYGAQTNFRLFYVLFLPVVWAASRQGFCGAVIIAAVLQIGMLLVGYLMSPEGISLFEVQMRAFLIALVAFLIGITLDELRRTSADLRESLRLAAAGEMAAALAHELNQPLTALTAYGTACSMLLGQREGDTKLQQTVQRMIAEAHRAAKVVARLRDFFRSGAVHMERLNLADLMATVSISFREHARKNGIDFSCGPVPADLVLLGDRVQLEVVMRNLLSNAADAVMSLPDGQRRVHLSVGKEAGQHVCICVEDEGPGPDANITDRIFEPFITNKSSGLGLGLAISRAIVEAHGGSLSCDRNGHGRFLLALPIESPRMTANG